VLPRGDSAWWSWSAWRLRLVELDGSEEAKRFVVERGPLPERSLRECCFDGLRLGSSRAASQVIRAHVLRCGNDED